MSKILAICTGNTCRSPMAEGVIKKLALDNNRDDIEVVSMGVSAFDGEAASENSVLAIKEIGQDLSNHKSRRVMLSDLDEADRIYCMTQEHKDIVLRACPEFEDKVFVLNIPDPFGKDLDCYRDCRDKIIQYFEKEFENI